MCQISLEHIKTIRMENLKKNKKNPILCFVNVASALNVTKSAVFVFYDNWQVFDPLPPGCEHFNPYLQV